MIVFCLSNLSVPTVISLVAERKDFVIYTDQKSIEQFFTQLYGGKHVQYIPMPPIISNKWNLYLAYKEMGQYKKQLLTVLGLPKNKTIYFFYNAFGFHVSWWLQLVSENNHVYYKPDIDVSMWKERYTLPSVLKTTYTKLLFSITTTPMWNGEKMFLKVSNRFIKQNNIHVIKEIPIDWNQIKIIIAEKFGIGNKTYLLLCGNTVADKLVEENEYVSQNDSLITVMGEQSVAVKVHPRFVFLYSKEKECTTVPSYVPANVIMDNFEIFVGYTSSVLFEAANRNKKAISLLYLFTPISEGRKENYRTYLDDNLLDGKQIYYPKNIAEFSKLVAEI